jgi:hypothetical protein
MEARDVVRNQDRQHGNEGRLNHILPVARLLRDFSRVGTVPHQQLLES